MSYVHQVVATTPQLFLPTTEAGGTAADDLLSANNGTYVGGPTLRTSAGPTAWAVLLDGVNDYIDLDVFGARFATATPIWTLAVWVKGVPADGGVLYGEGSSSSSTPGFLLRKAAGGVLNLYVESNSGAKGLGLGGLNGTKVAFDGHWHLVLLEINTTSTPYSFKTWVDAVADISAIDSTTGYTLNKAAVGAWGRSSGYGAFAAAAVSGVARWNRVLTADERARLYQSGIRFGVVSGPGAYGASAYGATTYAGSSGSSVGSSGGGVGATQTIDLTGASGAAPSLASVPGPTLTGVYPLVLGAAPSLSAVYGPAALVPALDLYLGLVPTMPAVFAPWLANDQVGANAVQYVSLGSATGGAATLTFAGQTTAPIAYNADGPTTIQAALEALANIAPGDVVVLGSWPDGVTVTFQGTYAGEPVATLVLDTTGLVGGSGAGVTEVRPGGSGPGGVGGGGAIVGGGGTGALTARLSVDVVPRSAPTSAGTELAWSWGRRCQRVLQDAGTGEVTVQNSDPARGLVGYFDLLRFKRNGRVRQTVVVERQRNNAVRRAHADRHTTFSGRGVLALLEDGIVLPYFGTDVELWSDVRAFNFASPDYDDSDWHVNPVATRTWYEDAYGVPYPGGATADWPARWPDLDAKWLWDRHSGYNDVPAGECYFRTTFNVASGSNAEVWVAADDAYELWLDGQLLVSDNAEGAVYLGQSKAVRVWLRPGVHYLGVYARNTTHMLKAGAMWSVVQLDGRGSITGVYARSEDPAGVPVVPVIGGGEPVKLLAYPPTPPGFTPGKVVRLLLAEAQGRGTCDGITRSFTDTADSRGAAWPITADLAFPLGLDLLSVVRQLNDTYGDWDMSPQLVLDAWAGGQGDTTATVFKPGGTVPDAEANVTEMTYDGSV